MGGASELLDSIEPPVGPPRRVRLHDVDRSALVLGSAQPYDKADQRRAAAAGVEVVRRRSGGGAVLLKPGRQVWADFFVPFGDALWSDDIGQAVAWVGDLWSSVAACFVPQTPTVFSGRLIADEWGRLVCFAGAGPGEVFVGGLKLVGVSQRRNSRRARIQTMAHLVAPPEQTMAHLVAPPEQTMAHLVAPPEPQRGADLAPLVAASSRDGSSEPDFLALAPGQRAAARAALQSRRGAIPASAASVTETLLNALGAKD